MSLLEAINDFTYKEGPDGARKNIEGTVLEYNKQAMALLRQNDVITSLDLLRKAERLLFDGQKQNRNDTTYRLIGITLNNLGCYYKKTNKPKVALKYLNKALQIEVYTLHDKLNIASTHLNICAIYSSLTEHKEGVKHAKIALDLLEAERTNYLLNQAASAASDKKQGKNDPADVYKNIITTMIMGYYNYATELEHTKDFAGSLKALTNGFELATRELGPGHALTITVQQSIQKLLVKKKEADAKSHKREEFLLRVSEEERDITKNVDQRPELRGKSAAYRVVSSGYGQNSKVSLLTKKKSKSTMKSRSALGTANSSQPYRTRLPEINQSNQRGSKPPSKARPQLRSIIKSNDSFSGLSQPIRGFHSVNTSSNQHSGTRHALPSDSEDYPNHHFVLKSRNNENLSPERNDFHGGDSDASNLDNQIHKLQKEIFQIETEDDFETKKPILKINHHDNKHERLPTINKSVLEEFMVRAHNRKLVSRGSRGSRESRVIDDDDDMSLGIRSSHNKSFDRPTKPPKYLNPIDIGNKSFERESYGGRVTTGRSNNLASENKPPVDRIKLGDFYSKDGSFVGDTHRKQEPLIITEKKKLIDSFEAPKRGDSRERIKKKDDSDHKLLSHNYLKEEKRKFSDSYDVAPVRRNSRDRNKKKEKDDSDNNMQGYTSWKEDKEMDFKESYLKSEDKIEDEKPPAKVEKASKEKKEDKEKISSYMNYFD